MDQVKDSVVQSKKVFFHVLDPYETIGHDAAILYGGNTIQYFLNVRVKNMPAGWRFDIEFIDTTTMLLIDRDSMIVLFALVDVETKLTSPASAWTETSDALATRTLWASGTNKTGSANMRNWVVENGALRQLKTRTAYEDPHTRQYTTGYSSLLLRSGYPPIIGCVGIVCTSDSIAIDLK